MNVNEFESPEDILAVQQLLKLKSHTQNDGTSEDTEDKFVAYVTTKLNEYTYMWKTNWGCGVCSDDNVIVFYTTIEWPMEHVIPFDLIPEIQQFIKRLSYSERMKCHLINQINIDYNRTERTLSFTCDCAFGLLDMTKCGNCGNCWDGHAQCMCTV